MPRKKGLEDVPGGGSVIHLAAARGDVSSLRLAVGRVGSKEVNRQDMWGLTPLHDAASRGYKSCVEELLELGARIDVQDNAGNTPLHLAAARGHVKVVYYLVRHGASITAVNIDRRTAMEDARYWGKQQSVKAIKDGLRDQYEDNSDTDAGHDNRDFEEAARRRRRLEAHEADVQERLLNAQSSNRSRGGTRSHPSQPAWYKDRVAANADGTVTQRFG